MQNRNFFKVRVRKSVLEVELFHAFLHSRFEKKKK